MRDLSRSGPSPKAITDVTMSRTRLCRMLLKLYCSIRSTSILRRLFFINTSLTKSRGILINSANSLMRWRRNMPRGGVSVPYCKGKGFASLDSVFERTFAAYGITKLVTFIIADGTSLESSWLLLGDILAAIREMMAFNTRSEAIALDGWAFWMARSHIFFVLFLLSNCCRISLGSVPTLQVSVSAIKALAVFSCALVELFFEPSSCSNNVSMSGVCAIHCSSRLPSMVTSQATMISSSITQKSSIFLANAKSTSV
mmetsp:Transcript_36152/g.58012  ORF Transcript_36152/g.58012 Transcript_36152/m.58012 type:complete len:256 (-) Transcript_36152:559-1326(-)